MKNNNPVTHFIEVYSNQEYIDKQDDAIRPLMTKLQIANSPQEISYLPIYLERTANTECLRTIAVWHIRLKTKSNNN